MSFSLVAAKIFQGLGPKRWESSNGDRVYVLCCLFVGSLWRLPRLSEGEVLLSICVFYLAIVCHNRERERVVSLLLLLLSFVCFVRGGEMFIHGCADMDNPTDTAADNMYTICVCSYIPIYIYIYIERERFTTISPTTISKRNSNWLKP